MPAHLTVACVGAGYFSQFHYDAWRRIESVTPVAAVDLDHASAAATGLAAYTDPTQMLRECRPDIVDIITPPPTHLAVIRAAIAAGVKAVICQKPFCAGPEEAAEVVRLSRESGVPLVVHENFRFQPWYRKMHQLIDEGVVGDVLQMTFRLRPGDGQGARAYLDRQPYFQRMPKFLVHETAIHWVDTFRFLLGEPQRVFADLRQLNPAIAGEDAGYILFAYPNGVRAIFDGNRLLDHAATNTRCTMGEGLLEGTRGVLSLRGDGSVHLRRFGEQAESCVLAPCTAKTFGGDCVLHLQQHVVSALRAGTTLENQAEDYLGVMAQETAIYTSSQCGSWVDIEAFAPRDSD